MKREDYLLIADTLTAVENESFDGFITIETVATALANAFAEHPDKYPQFDKVQFLNDCELAEAQYRQ